MVICNLCGEDKLLEEIEPKFRYVCKKCWSELIIGFNMASGFEKINKDFVY